MIIKFSDKVCKLMHEVAPYMVYKGGVREDAPEEIKKKYDLFRKLADEETKETF